MYQVMPAGWYLTLMRALCLAFIGGLLLQLSVCRANEANAKAILTVEEQRLVLAEQAMPELLAPFADLLAQISSTLTSAQIIAIGNQGFQIGKQIAHAQGDDRPLYWFRLAVSAKLRGLNIRSEHKSQLLADFELASRGIAEINFNSHGKRILVTGFDPFFLDRHIDQSNPSGLAVLQLDGQRLVNGAVEAEVQGVLIPVRFTDFDQGMIETLLSPYLKQGNIDMIVTISMGRDGFDLERFPGLRRSAEAPDNLNIFTGATKSDPLIPLLNGQPIVGPEFVEFSLPAAEMIAAAQQRSAPYPVVDNHQIESLKGELTPLTLLTLKNEIAVQGSGGGYLSNEISYRSIRLANEMGSQIPIGHIHTPRVQPYDKIEEQRIVDQIRLMLRAALPVL